MAPHDVWPLLAKQSGGYALETVHQRRKQHRGWIFHQQVDVIILAIACPQFRAEVFADFCEDGSERSSRGFVQNSPSIFCHKDQMHMKCINYRSSAPIIACIIHRPNLTLAMVIRKANTYRLYPTPEQAQQMAQIAGSCRFVFNLALEQRRDWWKPGRRRATIRMRIVSRSGRMIVAREGGRPGPRFRSMSARRR